MIQEAIFKVVNGEDLNEEEMIATMTEIMEGKATQAQIGSFITALRIKGETVDEITGAARVMREKAIRIGTGNGLINLDRDDINIDQETIVDTCGTGGDGTNTFNVSTTTAFVVAGAGLKVAKHGNRSVSSCCGSADVIEALGININITPEQVERCMDEVGIGFLFAPLLHGAMKYAIGPRREIGLRTIFNILGPLTNPAGANVQVLGVYDAELTHVLAEVLRNLGAKSAFVVHGLDCIDEISITGPTQISQLSDGKIKDFTVSPEELGFERSPIDSIRGGDARENASIVRGILSGENGPKRDVVLMNAAAALVAAGKASRLKEGVRLAEESIDSGKAIRKMEDLIAVTKSFG